MWLLVTSEIPVFLLGGRPTLTNEQHYYMVVVAVVFPPPTRVRNNTTPVSDERHLPGEVVREREVYCRTVRFFTLGCFFILVYFCLDLAGREGAMGSNTKYLLLSDLSLATSDFLGLYFSLLLSASNNILSRCLC